MRKFTRVTSLAIFLNERDIDTDQIIPARYLKGTEKTGLGAYLFANWRYHENGNFNESCVLNMPSARQSQILIAGDNFGCGSSREHAVWALTDYGFRCVISPSFADIFRNNALRNGLLTVEVKEESYQELAKRLHSNPNLRLTIDLEQQTLSYGNTTISFPIGQFSKSCLLQGTDELGYLLNLDEIIVRFEANHDMRLGIRAL